MVSPRCKFAAYDMDEAFGNQKRVQHNTTRYEGLADGVPEETAGA